MSATRLYPIFLDLARRPVMIVGGGAVARRKAGGLRECGAQVTVVSPRFSGGLGRQRGIRRIRAGYGARHMKLERWRLVFAATDCAAVNSLVQRDAAAAGILCCRCDDPQAGDFRNGATGQVSGVTLAVSTAGASPALAGRMRDQAQAALDPVLARLAGLFETWRAQVKARLADAGRRRLLLLRLAGEEMEETLRREGPAAARRLFRRWLAEAGAATKSRTTETRSHEDHPPRRTTKTGPQISQIYADFLERRRGKLPTKNTKNTKPGFKI